MDTRTLARSAAGLLGAAWLAGCAGLQPDPGRPGEAAAQSGACHADRVQWAIGAEATQDTMARVWRESHAGLLRPIAPGQPVTKEFRADRVNVALDRDNRIVRVYCG
jgi:hypothetical protein